MIRKTAPRIAAMANIKPMTGQRRLTTVKEAVGQLCSHRNGGRVVHGGILIRNADKTIQMR